MKHIDDIVRSLRTPIIEIGGPTPTGYSFLAGCSVKLPAKTTVTNISKRITINPFDDDAKEYEVDQVVDVRDMPYLEGEIGTIIACSLPYSDADILREFASLESRLEYLKSKKEIALEEYKTFTRSRSFKTNLHIALIVNSSICLVKEGHLIIEQARLEDKKIAELCGLELVWSQKESMTYIFSKL